LCSGLNSARPSGLDVVSIPSHMELFLTTRGGPRPQLGFHKDLILRVCCTVCLIRRNELHVVLLTGLHWQVVAAGC